MIADLLMQALGDLGCQAVLLTSEDAGAAKQNFSYPVVRTTNPMLQLQHFRECDGSIILGPSVRTGWPVFFQNKPTLIFHQGGAVQGMMQHCLMRRTRNVACSAFLAGQIGSHDVVPNPFDAPLFAATSGIAKTRDFVFLGRLVPDKGVDAMLHALQILRQENVDFTATIIGDGHSRPELEALATQFGIHENIDFAGVKRGEALAQLLASHRYGIVPSRWQEPFGIVALELIAAGCPVIASKAGGLPEAVGTCGMTFRNGDAADLAAKLRTVLEHPAMATSLMAGAAEHLARHHPHEIARALLHHLGISCP